MRKDVIQMTKKGRNLFLSSFLSVIFGILFVVILARLLGADVYGYIPLVRNIGLVPEVMLELGVSGALIKQLSTSKDKKKTAGVALSLKLMLGLIGTFSLVLASLLFPHPLSFYVLCISPLPVFAMVATYVNAIYRHLMKSKEIIILNITRDFTKVITATALALLGFGAISGIFGWVVGVALCAVIGAAFLSRTKFLSLRWDRKEAGKLVRFGVFFNSAALSQYLFPATITFVAAALLSITELSIIAVSMSLAMMIYLFLGPITAFVYPFMCEKHKHKSFPLFISFLLRYWFVFVFILSIGVFFGSSIIFGLLGNSFLIGSSIFWIVALAIFLDSFKTIADPLFAALDKVRIIFYAESMKFIVFFAAFIGLLMLNQMTLMNLSFAILLSYLTTFVIKFGFFLTHVPVPRITIAKIVLLFIILLAIGFVKFEGLLKLGVFAGFIALIFVTKLFKIQDFKYIRECLR